MSPPLPSLFFVLVRPSDEVRRLHLAPAVSTTLTEAFAEQRAAFFEDSQALDYDPGYRPERGQEHFRLKGYALPTPLAVAAAGPDAVADASPADFEEGRVKAVVAMSQTPKRRELLFQAFDSRQILKRASRLALLARSDRFDRLEHSAIAFDRTLAAVFDGSDLHFRSTAVVSRFLTLSEVFTEATDAEVTAFAAAPHFAPADGAALLALSDSWVRKKITEINKRQLLTVASVADVERVAADFGVPLQRAQGRIVLPKDKRGLKALLRVFGQDLLHCALTGDRFQVNSKRRIPSR